MEEKTKDLIDERLLLAQERTTLANERNRLANQRTFLSWIRTGLAGVGGGVGIVKLLSFHNTYHQMASEIVGMILIIWGIFIFFLAFVQYRRSFKKLNLRESEGISLRIYAALALTLILLSVTLLVII